MDMTTDLTQSAPNPEGSSVNVDLIAVLIIGLFGIFGNGVVVVVLARKEYRKKLSNLLLINQSIIDWAANFFLIGSVLSKSFPKSYETTAEMFMCYIFDSENILQAMVALSTNNLFLITMERYLMVAAPVFHRNRATKKSTVGAIVVTTLIHLLINLPLTFPYTAVIGGTCFDRAMMSMQSKDVVLISYSIIYLYGPVALFLITYPHMFFCLRKRTSIRPAATTTDQNKPKAVKALSKHELNLILVSVTITVSFVFCFAPTYLGYTLIRVGVVSPAYVGGTLWKVFNYLTFSNQVINPVVYAFSYNDFKRGFYKTFKIKLGRKATPGDETSAGHSTAA